MKISDNILSILFENGNSVSGVQFDTWLGQLYKAGYLKKTESPGRMEWELTEKGKQRIKEVRK